MAARRLLVGNEFLAQSLQLRGHAPVQLALLELHHAVAAAKAGIWPKLGDL
jgi:hypothetical protein